MQVLIKSKTIHNTPCSVAWLSGRVFVEHAQGLGLVPTAIQTGHDGHLCNSALSGHPLLIPMVEPPASAASLLWLCLPSIQTATKARRQEQQPKQPNPKPNPCPRTSSTDLVVRSDASLPSLMKRTNPHSSVLLVRCLKFSSFMTEVRCLIPYCHPI